MPLSRLCLPPSRPCPPQKFPKNNRENSSLLLKISPTSQLENHGLRGTDLFSVEPGHELVTSPTARIISHCTVHSLECNTGSSVQWRTQVVVRQMAKRNSML